MSSVAVSGATIDQAPEPRWPGPVILSTPVLANTTPAPVASRASNEGYPKVPKDFTITEKAPTTTRALYWLKAPSYVIMDKWVHYNSVS